MTILDIYVGSKHYLCLLFDEWNLVHNKKAHFLRVELLHPLEPHAGDEGLSSPRWQNSYQILSKGLNEALHLEQMMQKSLC